MKNKWPQNIVNNHFNITNGSTNTNDAVLNGSYPLFDRSVSVKLSNKYLFDTEAVIIPGEGKEFTPKYYKGKFDLHQRAYAISPKTDKNRVSVRYLYYWIDFNKSYLTKMAVGSTVKSLRMYILENFSIKIAPKHTQQKIANILSSVDNAIQKTDQIIQKAEKLKQGLMNELLTKGIGHKKFKKTTLENVAEITSSKRIYASDYVVDGIPFYRSKEIIEKHKNTEVSTNLFISIEKYNQIRNRFGAPTKNDILLTSVGTLGIPYKVKEGEKFYFKDGNLTWFKKIKKYINVNFLYYWLDSDIAKRKFEKVTIGSSQSALTIVKLKKVSMFFPNLQEQKEIVGILQSIDQKLNQEKKEKERLLKLKKGLMQDIFNQKVEVN